MFKHYTYRENYPVHKMIWREWDGTFLEWMKYDGWNRASSQQKKEAGNDMAQNGVGSQHQ